MSLSEAQVAARLFTCRRLHDLAAELEPCHWGGRPLEYNPVIPLVMEMIVGRTGRPQRDAVLNHTDETHWDYYRKVTRRAFPNEPDLWLDERPPSRSQIRYWLDTRLASDETIARYEQVLEDIAVEVGDTIGIGAPHAGDRTHPRLEQGLMGDATYLRGMYNTAYEEAIDKETGELRTRRFDPDALKVQQDRGYPGYRMTHVSAHTGHTREDIVYKIHISPGQQGNDATFFLDMVSQIHTRVPGMRTAVYDGAMHSAEIDRALSLGLIPMNKVQHNKGGAVASAVTGNVGGFASTT